MAATFGNAAVKQLREMYRRVMGTKSAPKQGPPRQWSGDNPDWFMARILGWQAVITDARWRYSWEEVLLENDGDIIYGGGMSGTVSDFYALNLREMNNVVSKSGTQGNSINQASNYPTPFKMLPVGGGTGGVAGNQVIVVMRINVDTLGVGRPFFEYENADQGPCS